MSVDLLQRAAAKARENADVYAYHSSPWYIRPIAAGWSEVRSRGVIDDDFNEMEDVAHDTHVMQMDTTSTAEHIASWHPNVALAIADLWEALAKVWHNHGAPPPGAVEACKAARTYLGEEA